MIVSLVLLVLIFAVAVRQSAFGLFSALIMMVLTLCCAAAAICLHEWVAVHWLAPFWKPDFSFPVAMGAVFGVPLILFRLLFDRTITRSCLVPVWVDRGGGALCGIITALTVAGIAGLCLQMVPFGRSLVGYAPVTSYAKDDPAETPPAPPTGPDAIVQVTRPSSGLWMSPDRFATAVASLLSAGVFSGEQNFYMDNPEFVEWISLVNAVPPGVSRFVEPGSVTVASTGRVDAVYNIVPEDPRRNRPTSYERIDPPPGTKLRVVRLQLGPGARDERKSIVFTLRQFRLVGSNSQTGRPVSLSPVALQQEDATDPINRHIHAEMRGSTVRPILDDVFSPREGGEHVEIVFAVPGGFQPRFIEYKRGGRAELRFSDGGAEQGRAPEPSPAPAAEQPSGTAAAPSPRSGGRARRVGAGTGGSQFGDRLPMTMRAYRRLANVSIQGDALANGHLVGRADQQESGSDPELARFAVPDDRRLLHLNSEFLRARSGLGRALSFAVGTLQNYVVTDANGNRYTLAGKYALADVDGVEYVEIQYFPGMAGTMGSGQSFAEIQDRHLQGDYTLVLLFLVEPGAEIVSFSSGSAAVREDNLRDQNLVAPR